MIEQSLLALSTDLVQNLFWFVAWTGLLCTASKIIDHWRPSWLHWSPFWLLLNLLAILPLLPILPMATHAKIPQVLLEAMEQGNHLWLSGQQVINTQTQVPLLAWQWFCCYLLVHLAIFALLKLVSLANSVKQLRQLEVLSTTPEQLTCFSLRQLAFIKQQGIQVCQAKTPGSAFVFGWRRPILFLPNYLSSLALIQQQLLIEHELVHIQRGDHKALFCLRLYRCLFWFNPFLAYFESKFIQSMEINCDRQVLQQHPNRIKDYARALVDSLKLSKTQSQHSATGLTAAFTQHQSNAQIWHQRLDTVLATYDVRGHRYIKIILSASCLLAVIFIAGVQASQQQASSTQDMQQQHAYLPVQGAKISAGFGVTRKRWGNKKHKGIDMAAPVGTQVVANMAGTVVIADDTSLHKNYGKVILLRHEDNSQSLYAHLDSMQVKAGQYVAAGEHIGKVGTTGRVSGPHLHFELLVAGKRVDPISRLPIQGL